MENRKGLFEDIVQRLSDLFQRSSGGEGAPDTDSAIETRRSSDDSVDRGGGSAYAWYSDETSVENKRRLKYKEYERMDTESVEVASALDIYADNATSGDRDGNETIEVVSESETVVEILNEVKNRLKLDFELWSIARQLVKYGDCFEELVVYPDLEVHRLKHLPPEEMTVVKDKWGRLDTKTPYQQVDYNGTTVAKFEKWQVIHFKLMKDRSNTYGVDGSMLYPLRKVFKQLAMIEDSLVIARLTRAQQRFAFMIDVNGVEPGEATAEYLRKVKNSMRKKRTIDPQTGQLDLKYNPLSVEEDLFLARRDGSGSDVKVLEGARNLGQLEDVEYFSKKLFAGLKVPKAWMGFEGDTHARAVITELDVQFAKTIRRVQQSLISGLRDLFDFVLVTRGIDPNENPYTLKLPIMSTVDEMRQWELEKIKAEVATVYKSSLGISGEWIYKNLLDMTDEEIEEIKNELGDEEGLAYVQAGVPEPDSTEVIDTDEEQLETLSPRELRVLRHKLKEELSALQELVEWEYEHKTSKKLRKEA
jgi:hypothetical protein